MHACRSSRPGESPRILQRSREVPVSVRWTMALAVGGRIGPRAAPLGGAVNGPSPSPSGRTGLLAPRIQGSATTHARPGDRGQPGRGGDHIEHTNPLREAPRRQWEGATEVAYVLR
jgi:hypothetical protein